MADDMAALLDAFAEVRRTWGDRVFEPSTT